MNPTFGPIAHGAGPSASSQLVVHASFGTFARGMSGNLYRSGPLITVDGHPVPGQWGPNTYNLAPGQHRVEVRLRYPGTGQAETLVSLAPATATHLYYRAPATALTAGQLGLAPQPTNGMRLLAPLAMVGIAGVAALVIMVIVGFLSLS